MIVVPDTNVVISGLLWHGAPRRILDLARVGHIKLFTSRTLLAELEAVLFRPKFKQRLVAAKVDTSTLVAGFSALAAVIPMPPSISPVCRDPSDDAILACALAASADLIVTGDQDLLSLKAYNGIPIRNSADAEVLLKPWTIPCFGLGNATFG